MFFLRSTIVNRNQALLVYCLAEREGYSSLHSPAANLLEHSNIRFAHFSWRTLVLSSNPDFRQRAKIYTHKGGNNFFSGGENESPILS
jgi:hypothetical protein